MKKHEWNADAASDVDLLLLADVDEIVIQSNLDTITLPPSRGMKRPLGGGVPSRESDSSDDREERLLKDRLRKRRSKEKAHLEVEALRAEVQHLESQIRLMKSQGRSSSTKYQAILQSLQSDIARAYDEQHRLKNTLVLEMEKGILYQSLSWRPSASQMVLDPRRDPWMMHSFPADPTVHDQALRSIMTQQFCKLTPDLYSQLPSSMDGGPFSIVLDECGQDVAFLEMRKFGVMRANCADVANGIFQSNNIDIAPSADIQLSMFGQDLALTTQRTSGGSTIRRILSITSHTPDRVVLMFRSLHYDAASSTYSPEMYAGWFVCENLPSPDGSPLCAVRGYTQVALQTTPQRAAADYTTYMNRSTKSNASLNDVLRQFNAIVLN